MVGPQIAAVVSVPRDRGCTDVETTLASLRRANDGDPATLEILVVGSARAGLEDVCRVRAARLIAGPGSVRAGRNLGAHLAAASVVLFLDAGCRASAGLVSGHLRHWSGGRGGLGAVAGSLRVTGTPSPALKAARAAGLLARYELAGLLQVPDSAAATNLSVRRDLMEELSGFDEGPALGLGGEDIDLCIRLRGLGWRIAGCPDAVAEAPADAWASARAVVAEAWRRGRVAYRLGRRHRTLLAAQAPRFALGALALLGICLAAAVRWRAPAAVAVWPGGVVAYLLVASGLRATAVGTLLTELGGRVLATVQELGHSSECLRRGDPGALCSGLAVSPGWAVELLSEGALDWTVMAGVGSLALLALALVGRAA